MHTRIDGLPLECTGNCLTFTNYVHRIQESGRLADVGLQLQQNVSSQFWGEVTTLEGDASGTYVWKHGGLSTVTYVYM